MVAYPGATAMSHLDDSAAFFAAIVAVIIVIAGIAAVIAALAVCLIG